MAVALSLRPQAIYSLADIPKIAAALRSVEGMPLRIRPTDKNVSADRSGDNGRSSTAVAAAMNELKERWSSLSHGERGSLSDQSVALLARSEKLRARFEGDESGMDDMSGSAFVMSLAGLVKTCGGSLSSFAELAFACGPAFAHLAPLDESGQRRALARAWARSRSAASLAFDAVADDDRDDDTVATPDSERAALDPRRQAALARVWREQIGLVRSDAGVQEREAFELLVLLTQGDVAFDRALGGVAERMGCGKPAVRALRKRLLKLKDEAERALVATDADDVGGGCTEALEPWPEWVDGAALADGVRAALLSHVAFPSESDADAATLWVIGTYLMDRWQLWPKLLIRSPEKRCGKTTLLEVLEAHVFRANLASNISPAALYRLIEAYSPTLLIDEADRFLATNEEMNGIINGSHRRRGAWVWRADKSEAGIEPVRFSTWCPQAIASIGRQMDTLEDRSIRLNLRRRLPGEVVAKLPVDLFESKLPVRRRLLRWTMDNADRVASSAATPPRKGSDRAQDNWTPLYRIADALGGEWPRRVEAAYMVKEAQPDADVEENAGVMLLQDLMVLFEEHRADRLRSADIVRRLIDMEDRPWPEWRRGQPMTTSSVARLLKPFDLKPRTMRFGLESAKGYEVAPVREACERYCGPVEQDPIEVAKERD